MAMSKADEQKALEEYPASRPGPIFLVGAALVLGAILVADNYTLIKGLLGL